MDSFWIDAVKFCGAGDASAVHPGHPRNFIAPPWPAEFWAAPVFTRVGDTAEVRLATAVARNSAAAAALDNMGARTGAIADEVERRLRPIEERVMEMANTLADLESAAEAAEMADAAADAALSESTPGEKARGADDARSEAEAREVQVVKNDPPLRYDANLPVDLLAVVYATRGASGSAGVVFGTWYRSLQESLVVERPSATRRIDYQGGRMSRTFMATAVASLQSCGRMYVGNRHYTALESAVLCLYAYYRATGGGKAAGGQSAAAPGSFSALLENSAVYLDHMATKIAEGGTRPRYAFDQTRLPKGQFAAPTGRYERDALAGHSVLTALVQSRVLPPAPGGVAVGGVASEIDAGQTAYSDEVNQLAAAMLGRAQPLFLMEDQTLLRSAVDTIVAMLLLRRLLWNTNVYGDRVRNAFQLGAFLPGAVPDDQFTRGASGSTPREAIKSDGRNAAHLFQRYAAPLYRVNRDVEFTQLFPGLVAICLEGQDIQGGAGRQTRRVLDVSTSRSQANLLRLVALELENRSRANVVSVREVIEVHDSVALQYERGLGALMQLQRPRATLFESKRLAVFNVESEYDLHYFLCLGYVPKFTSSA
uniref:UL25 family protein n=1 Tax=Anatid alphaherpesvirus 2 TaxID=3080522 RepID=A0AAU0K7E3_9ALPH